MNITKLAEQHIRQHPSIKDALQKGLINYSSLTRMIARENNLDIKGNFDAILIACRRFAYKIKKEKSQEHDILDVLKKSKTEVKNKIIAAVVAQSTCPDGLIELQKKAKKAGELFNVVQGSSSFTILTAADFKEEIQKLFKGKILRLNENLAAFILKSHEELEDVPGVLSYLSSLLAENGINVVEQMSCWTDTLFVVGEKDAGKAMELMRF